MTDLAQAQQAYRDELLRAGLLISMGVDGLYGRSGTFEHVIERINAAFSAVGFSRNLSTSKVARPATVRAGCRAMM